MLQVQDSYAPEVDPFFRTAGLSPRTFGLQSRIYEGRFHGRKVNATISPRTVTRYAGEIRHRRYIGHQFALALGVSCATRFVAAPAIAANGFSRRINRWVGLTQVHLNEPGLDYLEIWATEPEWARRWLAEPNAAESLAALLPPDRRRNVSLAPVGELGFTLRTGIQYVQRSDLAGWMNDLFVLAEAADAAPPPLRRIQPSRIEMVVREKPWMSAIVVLLGLMALTVAITGVLFLAFLFVMWLL